jgi:hypothetical protein
MSALRVLLLIAVTFVAVLVIFYLLGIGFVA